MVPFALTRAPSTSRSTDPPFPVALVEMTVRTRPVPGAVIAGVGMMIRATQATRRVGAPGPGAWIGGGWGAALPVEAPSRAWRAGAGVAAFAGATSRRGATTKAHTMPARAGRTLVSP